MHFHRFRSLAGLAVPMGRLHKCSIPMRSFHATQSALDSTRGNRVVFLAGEPITTQKAGVMQRLEKMRYHTLRLEGGFLKWFIETNDVKDVYEWGNSDGAAEQARAAMRDWKRRFDDLALKDAKLPDCREQHVFAEISPIDGLIYHPLFEEAFESECGVEWLRDFRARCGDNVMLLLCECSSEHEAAFRLGAHKFAHVERDELLQAEEYDRLYRVFTGKSIVDEFDAVKCIVNEWDRLLAKYASELTGKPWDREQSLLHTVDTQQGTCALLETHCGIQFKLPSFARPPSSQKKE